MLFVVLRRFEDFEKQYLNLPDAEQFLCNTFKPFKNQKLESISKRISRFKFSSCECEFCIFLNGTRKLEPF